MSVPRDYLKEYNALPSADRKRILRVLMYWGGWTKTSVYRKLSCPNLSPIEEILVSGVMQRALAHQADGTQLTIDFRWDHYAGFQIADEEDVATTTSNTTANTTSNTSKVTSNDTSEDTSEDTSGNGSILFP